MGMPKKRTGTGHENWTGKRLSEVEEAEEKEAHDELHLKVEDFILVYHRGLGMSYMRWNRGCEAGEEIAGLWKKKINGVGGDEERTERNVYGSIKSFQELLGLPVEVAKRESISSLPPETTVCIASTRAWMPQGEDDGN
ncbi:hypothetical protein EV421DRAFT_1734921 [Armillaria borealis]|uniref:Uncharacterized protein n=1 Tax=Armillaria borealis TaxID=47425 RepID=A0AA39JMG6_9AGAR|nr:hypothetical protein EV421DRAFT_1734921 [Armillaria borealis]